ncbi:MAG: hypothetical protein F4X44_02290 [Gammaproteobacteria bacterium]|nr:hypothetical protein [Gammaproteobacteria bacterium]MYD79423.1 hypothetical protein [Gammaproteobacteria bacterium]
METIEIQSNRIESMPTVTSSARFGPPLIRGLTIGLTVLFLQLGVGFFNGTGLVGGQVALAQTATEDPRPKRNVPTMSSETYDRLAKFYEIMSPTDDEGNVIPLEEVGERDLPAAQKILDNLLARHRRLNGNEMAQVHRNYAWLAQEMDDIDLAIEHLLKLLDYRENINYVLEEMALSNVSKLYFTQENYEQALDYALQHLDLKINEGPNDYVYVAQIYIAMEDYENTKIWIKLAITTAEEQMKPIKEYWYEILLASVSVLEQWDEVLDVAKTCIVRYGKLKYWLSMAQSYMQLDDEENALYTLECAHTAGLLDKDKEFTNYASMLALTGAAIRAAAVLEEGLESEILKRDTKLLKWLAQYYQISFEQELAIKNYKLAAEDSDDAGNLWARLAQLHNELGQFTECIEAAETALDLGDLNQPNRVWLTKGSCEFSAEEYGAAKTTFTDLRKELLRSDEESDQALALITRSYLKSIEVEQERILHEQQVRADELAYEEEKRKRS